VGGVVGGLFLLLIIALLLIIIIILLYRNARSKGKLTIADNMVAYTAAGQDQGANVIINPNPSYRPFKQESNVYTVDQGVIINPNPSYQPFKQQSNMYSAGPEGDYEEIGEGSTGVCNPAYNDTSDSGYVVKAIDLTRPQIDSNDYSYVRKL